MTYVTICASKMAGELMSNLRALSAATLALAVMTGCHGNNQNADNGDQPNSSDPATANLAYASDTTTQNPPAPPADNNSGSTSQQPRGYSGQTYSSQQAAPPASEGQGYSDQGYQDEGYSDEADNQPPVYAPEPPPVLPVYDQPACPGDNYIWTPGYWSYTTNGYFWVPGAWVLAPFYGALWTPGYWLFDHDRYRWQRGFWGPHIGYYGGVNYGHGYFGGGYEGGYWNHDHFYYNRAVTQVNTNIIHNDYVYNYKVTNIYNNNHVAYVGGQGGLTYRPTPAQLAAERETHFAPLPAQRQVVQTAEHDRSQFVNVNHGHPQLIAENRPFNGGRTAPAAPPPTLRAMPSMNRAITNPAVEHAQAPTNEGHPALVNRPAEPAHGNEPARATDNRPNASTERNMTRQNPERPETPQHEAVPAHPVENRKTATQARPETHNQPQARPEARPETRTETRTQPHPEPQPRPEARPQSRPEAQPRSEARPQPQPHPEAQPRTEARPQPQARPEAQPRPEARPQQPRPEAHPQQQHPQPQHPESHPQEPHGR